MDQGDWYTGFGTLPGDVSSGGVAINDGGEVVGASFDKDGNSRAYRWQDGLMSDLNTLVPANSPLFLLFATGINASGEIAGFGAVKSTCMGDPSLCEVHAFLASPGNGPTGRGSAVSDAEGGHGQTASSFSPKMFARRFGSDCPSAKLESGLPGDEQRAPSPGERRNRLAQPG